MESYHRFKEHMANLGSVSQSLQKEKESLLRQRYIFEQEHEAASLMADTERIIKADAGLSHIEEKLRTIEEQLNSLAIEPFAQAVFDEGEAYLNSLVHELQNQFVKVYEARDLFIEEIKKLAIIRGKSCDVRNWTSEASPYLRRNPLDPLPIREFHKFVVDIRLLQSILGK